MIAFIEVGGVLLALAIAGMPIHFLVYAFIGRRMTILHNERGIFFYHLASALMLSSLACAGVLAAPSPETAAIAAAIVAGHGIYSLTFLEFWSLSQISYSREILLRAKSGAFDGPDIPQDLLDIGEQKRAGRLRSLSAIGLIEEHEHEWQLTAKGRIASAALRLLQWLPNMHGAG